jgi:hypothetical protein
MNAKKMLIALLLIALMSAGVYGENKTGSGKSF